MLKSYLPSFYNTWFFITVFVLWSFDLYFVLGLVSLIYFFHYFLFRKNRNDFRDDTTVTQGVVFSPVNGKVMSVNKHVFHPHYGKNLIEIQLSIPWWKEMGISLPWSCEVKDMFVSEGPSFFRYLNYREKIKEREYGALNLELENKGQRLGLVFIKCILGFWPEIGVMPGDRGSRWVNIGFFPYGGTVILYLTENYDILVKENDEIVSGNTMIAALKE